MKKPFSLIAEFAGITVLPIAVAAVLTGATWASPEAAPAMSGDRGDRGELLEATVVSRHRGPIVAQVWVGATLHRLGTVRPGQERRFDLPAEVTPGTTYYLVTDCADGHRIASDPIVASLEEHPKFVVSLNQKGSYVKISGTSGAER